MSFFGFLFSAFINICWIILPTSAYFLQYLEIKKSASLGTFSYDVCATLIISMILRMEFWFGEQYATVLFIQAFVMLCAQILLLKISIKIRNKTYQFNGDDYWKNFWRWKHFEEFVRFIIGFAIATLLITILLYRYDWYVQTIGSLSVLFEAYLAIPQLLSNMKNKSTDGLSIGMVLVWFSGDLLKSLYFFYMNQPLQFKICGLSQVLIDSVILGQIYYFRFNRYENMDEDNTQSDSSSDEEKKGKQINISIKDTKNTIPLDEISSPDKILDKIDDNMND